MSTVFLREMVAKGFCGVRIANDQKRGMGYISTVLDKIFLRNLVGSLSDENGILQLALQYGIPYEERPIFERCARGIHENLNIHFGAEQIDVPWGEDTIRFVRVVSEAATREAATCEALTWKHLEAATCVVEPVYDYCPMNDYVPAHSLAAEALMLNKDEKPANIVGIRAVWVNGGHTVEQGHAVAKDHWITLVKGAMSSVFRRAGPHCLTCPEKRCIDSFSDSDFDAILRKWLDLRKSLSEAEALLRHHLTYEGPTKSGTHLWYMDEGAKRFFDEKRRAEFLAKLAQLDPAGYAAYLRPDSTKIFKAIKEGKLSEEIASFFKTTKYWTIESKFSL